MTSLHERAAEADRAATFGHLPADALLAELETSGEAERLWARTLRAKRWLLDPRDAHDTQLNDALATRAAAHPAVASRLCAVMAQAARLAFDWKAHDAWVALHRRVGEGVPRELNECWARLIAGELELDAIESLSDACARDEHAEARIEATAMHALAAIERGDIALATTKARRASRMARTEGAPHAEYLANVVLARLRRVAGRAHLAARILSALARVAPSTWHGWLAWELALAGRVDDAVRTDHPSDAMMKMLLAAREGEVETMRAAFARLANDECAWVRSDATTVWAACDADADLARASDAVARWCRGDVDDPPAGLYGLCSRDESSESLGDCVAFVVAGDRQPRRVLALALPLVVSDEEAAALRNNARQQARADTAIAVLTLAGESGLSDEAFFRATYGFEYSAAQHRGVFDVLKHRMRKQLGGYSKLQSGEGHNVVHHDGRVVVPDPRCCQPLSDSVLRALASGSATAKELAKQLCVPLRTAQLALKQLVEEGACQSTREGRRIHYVLEDTTFREPTRH